MPTLYDPGWTYPRRRGLPLDAAHWQRMEDRAFYIEQGLSKKRVTARVWAAHDAPQVDVYRVLLATGADPDRLRHLRAMLAYLAGSDDSRVIQTRQGEIYVEVPKPPELRRAVSPMLLSPWLYPPPSPWHVPLGLGIYNEPIWWNVAHRNTAHLIIAGTTGCGKTNALRWILYRLLRQNSPRFLRMVMCDPKGGELAPFCESAHLLHPIETGVPAIRRLLRWAWDETSKRKVDEPFPCRLLVVIDELAELMQGDRQIGALVGAILRRGRAVGVNVIATSQAANKDAVGMAVNNFTCRLVGRVTAGVLSYSATGRSGAFAEQLMDDGDFLFIAGQRRMERLQVPEVRDEHLARIPHTSVVERLELGEYVDFAALAEDRRGGWNRKALDWQEVEGFIAGLDADDPQAGVRALRNRFGINVKRAERIWTAFWSDDPDAWPP